MFDFKIVPDAGEAYELTADSRDVYLWERTNKGKNLVALRDSLAMGDLYKLAHLAAVRTGRWSSNDGTFDQFVTSHAIDLQDDDEEGDEPDPTHPAP